ncbi:hypothetical protein LY78DRAFT_652805 [Colletotrichum sublineola]|nr:hypothetical protein LY78DRAFT_652805 [Colletotrichum sublineola]
MCKQVDKQFECGHTGFHDIKWCSDMGKGCKGPKLKHDIISWPGPCTDCANRAVDPNPRSQ